MSEQWRPIPCYEGKYEASDLGRVRSLDRVVRYSDGRSRTVRQRIRRQVVRPKTGYCTVNLSDHNCVAVRYVHRLVAEAFLGPSPEGMQVCHSNGNASDNRLPNLRYDTAVGNQGDRQVHGTTIRGEQVFGAKLTAKDVLEIRSLRGVASCDQLAARFPVNRTSIKRIWAGRTWRHV